MNEPGGVELRDLTTFRVGGPATAYVEARTAADLMTTVCAVDEAGDPLLLVGGGSNLLVADRGWGGTVVRIASTGVGVERSGDRVEIDVAAGEDWDDLVALTVAEGWSGLECLSGIPGCSGATPIQNVGAYGVETADVTRSVDVWDRTTGEPGVLTSAQCGFGYRTSIFKHAERHVVLGVRFVLRADGLSAPIRYAELARTLGVAPESRVPVADARAAVLDLRRAKGMVLDAGDHDTWSAGSFFTNPVVAATDLPDEAPAWPAGDLVKTSAAWLIERAGFGKGFGADLTGGRASLSTKHTLAVTNRGSATAADLLTVARTVRDGVREQFGIDLQPEPRLVGCSF